MELGMKDELETRSYFRRFLFLLHFGRCIICWLETYSTVKGPYCAIRNTSYHFFLIKELHGIRTISITYLTFMSFKLFYFL